jgi:hypothetical protein
MSLVSRLVGSNYYAPTVFKSQNEGAVLLSEVSNIASRRRGQRS